MFVCKDAPEYRLRRGHQQREANYKGSKKEEEVTRVLSGFSLMQSSLILASVYNLKSRFGKTMTLVFIA